MEVELHDVSPGVRPALKGRLDNYRTELSRLRKQFVSQRGWSLPTTCTCTSTPSLQHVHVQYLPPSNMYVYLPPSSLLLLLSLALQKQSQVSLGGQGMRRELMGAEELYTSEDQVCTCTYTCTYMYVTVHAERDHKSAKCILRY